jgi:lanthionine synthetase-like protein
VSSRGNWESIIDPASALGVRAHRVLEAITGNVLAAGQGPSGWTGRSFDAPLLLAYRALAEDSWSRMRVAADALNSAIAGADALYSTRRLELFGGLSGLGWVIEHITRQSRRFEGSPHSGEDNGRRPSQAIDTALLLELQRGRWKGTYDLATGLTGIGLYFLESLPAAGARKGLELVFAHLEDDAQRTGVQLFDGATGVASGVCGLVYLLSEVRTAGIEVSRSSRLLARCIEVLDVSCRRQSKSLAWSAGDLGIAAVCLLIQPGAGSEQAQSLGAGLLERCLELEPEVREPDPSLLTGAAGTAHLWNRIWQSGGDSRCREASLRCWEKTIDLYDKSVPATEVTATDFLGGEAGVGLALQAALTRVAPDWDGILCARPRY